MQTVTGRHPYRFHHHEVYISVLDAVLAVMYLTWYSKQKNVVFQRRITSSQAKEFPLDVVA
jgi:hypothetical protein